MTAAPEKAALWYAARLGWPVLPVHTAPGGACSCGRQDCTSPGKHPRTPHGVKDATTDAKTIRGWWLRWPDANLGIATGAPGPVVLDVDPRHGGDDSLADLEHQHGRMPDTVEALTGGGGRHVCFVAPTGVTLRNTAGQLGAGLDIRAAGGFVVGPPSVHASGRAYEWEGSGRPGEVPLAAMPAWLVELLRVPTPANGKPAATPPGEWARLSLADVTEGHRNATVAKVAGLLLRRYVDPHLALELVLAWNTRRCRPPLDEGEVIRTVDSIAARELRRRGGAA